MTSIYRTRLVFTAFAGMSFACILIRFPPETYTFYPRCPFYAWTHLQCPGCGATRALAALLRGHLLEALRWNALFVATMPLLAAYGAWHIRNNRRHGMRCWPPLPGWTVPIALAVAALFCLVRNLPR